MLSFENLQVAYPGRVLWQGWSAQWPAGVGLARGGDGGGKTTLLRVLAGRVPAQQGQVLWQGAPIATQQVFWVDPRQPDAQQACGDTPARWLAAQRRQWRTWDEDALQRHVAGWVLAAHWDKPWRALSTGTQRKVFMAAALASGAPLALIDEPVAGLDQPSIHYLQQALAKAAARTDRLVLVAHYEALAGVAWSAVVDMPALG